MPRPPAANTGNLTAGRALAPAYAKILRDAYVRAIGGIEFLARQEAAEPSDVVRALALLHGADQALAQAEIQLVGTALLAGGTRTETAAALGIRRGTLTARLEATRTWATLIGTELVPDPERPGNWLIAAPDASSENVSRSSATARPV